MTTEITNESLQQLKALAEAATPGPWRPKTASGWVDTYIVGDLVGACEPTIATVRSTHIEFSQHTKNASFIASSNPATILALIAKVESLAADAERLDHLFSKLPLNMFCAALGISPPDTGWKINSVDDWARQQLDAAMAKEKA